MRVYDATVAQLKADLSMAPIIQMGTSVLPAEYRLIEYSEVNYDRYTGEINILPGSTIDEGNFTVIRPANEVAQAYLAKEAISNLPDKQFTWVPDINDENTWIHGYKKDISLTITEEGVASFNLRIVGLKNVTPIDSPGVPVVVATDLGDRVEVKTDATNATTFEVLAAPNPTRDADGRFNNNEHDVADDDGNNPSTQKIRVETKAVRTNPSGYFYQAKSIRGNEESVWSEPVVAIPGIDVPDVDVGDIAVVFVYKAANAQPGDMDKPTEEGTYTFATNSLVFDPAEDETPDVPEDSNGWQTTAPDVGTGERVWIRTATATGNITDTIATGDWGAVLPLGAAGAEGVGVEYIFSASSDANGDDFSRITVTSRPDNEWRYDHLSRGAPIGDPVVYITSATVGSGDDIVTYHDGVPTNLGKDKPYLIRFRRAVPGAPTRGDAPTDAWGDWVHETPILVVGQDATGQEFIYQLTNSESAPDTPTTTETEDAANDHVPSGWSDNPPSPTAAMRFVWASRREKSAGYGESWSKFGSPFLWTRWGLDGRGIEFIYRRTSDSKAPTFETGTNDPSQTAFQVAEYTPTNWTDEPTGVDADNPYEWVSSRLSNQNGQWSAFREPKIWAIAGTDGEEGIGVEYIFTSSATGNRITRQRDLPKRHWTYDNMPAAGMRAQNNSNQWYFDGNPPNNDATAAKNLSKSRPYLIRFRRSVPGQPTAGDSPLSDTNDNNSDFKAGWSDWVQDAATLAIGEDGAGFELIFTRTATDTAPANPTPRNSDNTIDRTIPTGGKDFDDSGYVPTGWNDDPLEATTALPYVWYARRISTNGVWQAFSNAFRWAAQGQDGADGEFDEYIYLANDGSSPAAPDNSWTYDNPQSPWADAAPSLSGTNNTLWRSSRSVQGGASPGDAVSATWLSPTILSYYGQDGEDGEQGSAGVAGADGEDGRGFEWIFTANDGTTPSSPSNSWGYDAPQSPWSDGAPNLTATNNTLWRSSRRVEGSPAAGDAISDTWRKPTVVGRFGEHRPALP